MLRKHEMAKQTGRQMCGSYWFCTTLSHVQKTTLIVFILSVVNYYFLKNTPALIKIFSSSGEKKITLIFTKFQITQKHDYNHICPEDY